MQGVAVILALSCALVTAGAGAQTLGDAGADAHPADAPGAPPSGSRVGEAQAHIREAMQRFRTSDYAGALHEFELANEAAPSPEIWYNIARAHELLHEYEAAAENLHRYLRDKVDPPDRAQVEAHITELEALAARQSRARRQLESGATIHVEVTVRDARIFVDDQPRGTSPSTATWPVDPGVHGVRVEAPGRLPWRAEVRVRPGEPALVLADPLPATRYRMAPATHIASGIIGGLGAAALAVGVGFGVAALATDCSRCNDLTDRSTRADVTLGVATILGVAAAIVYFVERGANRTEVVTP